MKRILFWTAMAAAVMSSCSSDEDFSVMQESPQNAISFGTYVGQAAETKGVPMTDLKETAGIGIFGFYNQTGELWEEILADQTNPLTGADYMNNVNATYKEETSKWAYSPLKFWPESGTLHFWAYYPFTASGVTEPEGGANGVYNVKYTGFSYKVGSDPANHVDLLGSMATNLTKETHFTSGVRFTMQHLLSKIAVNVKLKESLADGTTATLKSVTLGKEGGVGFYTGGTYTMVPVSSAASGWGSLSGTQTFGGNFGEAGAGVVFNTTEVTLFGTGVGTDGKDNFLLIIPQDFSTEGGELPISVTYDMKTADSDLTNENVTFQNVTVTSLLSQNFEAGKAYSLELTLNMQKLEVYVDEVKEWVEVTPTDNVDLGSDDNAYIINPTNTGFDALQRVYKLGGAARANQFWGIANSNYGVDATDVTNNTIGSTTEWIAEVIWQDSPKPLIQFCNSDGTTEGEEGKAVTDGKSYNGQGETPFYFKPASYDARGNVVIGIRKKNDTEPPTTKEYLWSWHLWVTDYDPTPHENVWKADEYEIDVPGGHVYRYLDKSDAANLWGTAATNADLSASNVMYKDKFMMDRNLGALTADPVGDVTMTYGLHYQFGRKDPFPVDANKADGDNYDIAGKVIPTSKVSENLRTGPVSIKTAVLNPFAFYYSDNSTDWVSNNTLTGNYWNDASQSVSYNDKSLFDPSPAGWKLPVNGTWNIFSTDADADETGWYVSNTTNSTAFNEDGGSCFRINGGVDVSNPITTFYPAAGCRAAKNGNANGIGTRGYYWSATPCNNTVNNNNVNNGYGLIFGSNDVRPENNASRCYGFSVRCIQK